MSGSLLVSGLIGVAFLSLPLLVGDEYLSLSTQQYQPRSRAVLVDIARAVLERF